ncbi:MAG: hypothetical protein M3R14_17145, partial [Acidobacteriota bacterium]|nr:hypothetical protein [Acidobacteriota bacterium]
YLSRLACSQCRIIFNLEVKLDVVQNNILIEATGKYFILIVGKKIEEIIFSAKHKLWLRCKK